MAETLLLALLVGCGTADGGPSAPALTASGVEVLSGDGQIDTVGQQLPVPILVQVVDTNAPATAGPSLAAPVPGQLVNFVVVSGGGSMFVPSVNTDSAGHAQDFWTLGTTAGAQCVEARAMEGGTPITYATICATAVPGAPVHLTIDTTRQRLTVDSAWNWRSRVISVSDQFGNPRPVDLATATGNGLVVTGDSTTASAESDGWLYITAGATDSVPWSARRELRGAWSIAYRCSGPKLALYGNDGVTPLDSISFVGTVDFTPNGAAWTYASTMTVTHYLQGGGTEQSPSGDVFPASQGIGTLTVGGVLMAADGTGYTGGNFCGASLWNTYTPAALTR